MAFVPAGRQQPFARPASADGSARNPRGDTIEIVAVRPRQSPCGPVRARRASTSSFSTAQRANAGVGSGDFVEVRQGYIESCRPRSYSRPRSRTSGFRDRPMRSSGRSPAGRYSEGDTVGPPVAASQMPDMPEPIRQMLNAPAFALQELRLIVVSTTPRASSASTARLPSNCFRSWAGRRTAGGRHV